MLPAALFVFVVVASLALLWWLSAKESQEPPASILEEAPNETFVPRAQSVAQLPKPQQGLSLLQAIAVLLDEKQSTLIGEEGDRDRPIPKRLKEKHAASVGLSDAEFEELFDEYLAASVGHRFYTTLAGCSHLNDDGTRRDVAIARCHDLEVLDLVHDPDNKFSKNAMKVLRKNGEQLGWLPERTAGEIYRAMFKRGERHSAIFRHANYHPKTGVLVGAVVLIVGQKER